MKSWKVIAKSEKRIDSSDVELHLTVERGGVTRDRIVSGATFYSVEVGGVVMLPDHSGTSESQVKLLGEALMNVLVRAGVINKDAPVTGPMLLLAAEGYCKSPPPVHAAPSLRGLLLQTAHEVDKSGADAAGALLSKLEEYGKGDCPPENIRLTLLAMAMLEGAIEELR